MNASSTTIRSAISFLLARELSKAIPQCIVEETYFSPKYLRLRVSRIIIVHLTVASRRLLNRLTRKERKAKRRGGEHWSVILRRNRCLSLIPSEHVSAFPNQFPNTVRIRVDA